MYRTHWNCFVCHVPTLYEWYFQNDGIQKLMFKEVRIHFPSNRMRRMEIKIMPNISVSSSESDEEKFSSDRPEV